MKPLHYWTATLRSRALEKTFGAPVYLKMESQQPTGSFKIRGIGHTCQKAAARGVRHFVSSSGGNAGYAVAYAGAQLGIRTTVFVPSRTSAAMRAKIEGEGARVEVHGEVWDDAHAAALEAAARESALYIHPFDHPDLWEGHASMVEETARDLTQPPGAVVVAVGGGGLLCGILEGLHRVGWAHVPVLAVETEGAASLAAALKAGKPVTLDGIHSIALTLGARTVTPKALEWARRHPIASCVVSDRAAVDACLAFADDHRVLVEPACGAALSAVYRRPEALAAAPSVLAIVCGGAAVTREQLAAWDRSLA